MFTHLPVRNHYLIEVAGSTIARLAVDMSLSFLKVLYKHDEGMCLRVCKIFDDLPYNVAGTSS